MMRARYYRSIDHIHHTFTPAGDYQSLTVSGGGSWFPLLQPKIAPAGLHFCGKEMKKSLRIILWHDLHFLAVMYNKDKMVLECVWHGVCPFAGEKEGERDREYYREAVCPAAV